MSKLENDCISVLKYAHEQWPRWVPISELSRRLGIPPSTLRNMFLVATTGVFMKYDGDRTSIHGDVFVKIATKYKYNYRLMKRRNTRGHKTWHISATKMLYNYE